VSEPGVAASGPGPLHGLRVVEAASMILVPAAAAMLADFGADVVKVEPLEGDQNRRLHELPALPDSPIPYSFLVDNRSKRGIAVDLKAAEGRAILDRLLAGADVFMTNYRPAALGRLRLRWEDLAPRYPRLVYASGSGFGDGGPDADRPAYDTVVYWSRSGIEGALFPADGWLAPIPAGAGDHPSATALFGAVMLGLLTRARTGRGMRVGTSLLANGVWANATTLQAQLCGAVFHPKRRREETPSPGSVYFRTRDGRLVKLALVNPPRDWPNFLRALGRSDLVADPRLATADARRQHAAELIALLDATFAQADAEHWRKRLEAHDVAFAILPTHAEIVADPQAEASGLFPTMADSRWGRMRTVDSPITLPDVAKTPPRAAPEPGAHTHEVLRELGYSVPAIADLAGRGIIGSPAGGERAASGR
jgi:crotonobetainyl-CoA:carnitine CoA-transferase CaiB-like acyl-CoA transferase